MQSIFLDKKKPISLPSDIASEAKVMSTYSQILQIIKQKLTQETTLEQDLELLETQSPPWMMKMSVTYRVEMKKIVDCQLDLASMV